ncbi:enoyl-CoA hydratase/isomerase family protein [Dactylosporangium sp. NPDC051484]|uniref:enoyl-CoA hydratase/isomerase family protein n=1 Tax=Dactylosporangium sp. NPDC051484 TaxID=3154942 RepID=UPI00344D90AC
MQLAKPHPIPDTQDAARLIDEMTNGHLRWAAGDDGVVRLTLNRPDKLNAINRDMVRGLRAAVRLAEEDPDVRVLIVAGEGRVFSAGGDLAEVSALVRDRDAFDGFLDEWHDAFDAIEACSKPVIGQVHGVALAGGFELLQVCDVVIAARSARLGDQHARFGLFPAGGGTQRLARLIGLRRATWMLVTGEAIDADTAERFGLVNRVVDDGELAAVVDETARTLNRLSPRATAAIKASLRLGEGLEVHQALRAERPLALDHMASDDAQIGFEAFRQRREPDFGAGPR